MARSGARRILAAAAEEPPLLRAVLEAIGAWLAGNARAVLAGGATEPPDMAAWLGKRAWDALVEKNIVPAVEDVWLRRWNDSRTRSSPDRWLSEYIRDVKSRLTAFATESFEVVREELRDGLSAGESIRQLRDRIGTALDINAPSRDIMNRIARADAVIADPDASPAAKEQARRRRRDLHDKKDTADRQWQWRAERIARTETIGAFNGGSYAAAFTAATRQGERVGLEWWATRDTRTRETHRAAHGQIVPVGERFRVGSAYLLYPGDPTGPANEVINCRCVPLEVDL